MNNFKPTPQQISYVVSLLLGIICVIVSFVIPFWYYIITIVLAIAFLGYGIYGLIKFKKQMSDPYGYNSKPKRERKFNLNRYQHVKRIDGDNAKVMSICPNCQRNIRLPNVKGKHDVTCPICKTEYKVRI